MENNALAVLLQKGLGPRKRLPCLDKDVFRFQIHRFHLGSHHRTQEGQKRSLVRHHPTVALFEQKPPTRISVQARRSPASIQVPLGVGYDLSAILRGGP